MQIMPNPEIKHGYYYCPNGTTYLTSLVLTPFDLTFFPIDFQIFLFNNAWVSCLFIAPLLFSSFLDWNGLTIVCYVRYITTWYHTFYKPE